jgi:hypothetical protein
VCKKLELSLESAEDLKDYLQPGQEDANFGIGDLIALRKPQGGVGFQLPPACAFTINRGFSCDPTEDFCFFS